MSFERLKAIEHHLGRIATRVRNRIGEGGFEDPTPSLIQDYARDRYEREAALRGWRNLRAGRSLMEGELDALEQLVLPLHRPSLDIIEDTFNDPDPPWNDLWQYQAQLSQAIRAVCVIKIYQSDELLFNSTAVLVAPGLVMTNRHVAEQLASGVGTEGLKPHPERSAVIDFRQEIWASEPEESPVQRVRLIHPHWDMALLEVDTVPDREVMTLMGSEPPFFEANNIVTIGYPVLDTEQDIDLQGRVFREQFNVKRLQPGQALGYHPTPSYNGDVRSLAVDSSSLAINSGAAIIDLDTGRMIGLQFFNIYLAGCFAIPTWELAQDPRLVEDWGLTFEPSPPQQDSPPAWLAAWETQAGESIEAEAPPAQPSRQKPQREQEHRLNTAILGGDWYERCEDEDIVEALRRSPEATEELLRDVLSPQQATEVVAALKAPASHRHSFWPNPDPDLPELVFVPDFMGCHLSHTGTALSRVWLDPQRVLSGEVAEALKLSPDGIQEAHGERPMTPGAPLRFKYAQPLRLWRQAGFVVHPFSFDWRHGVDRNADKLHLYLETLRLSRPHATFAFVAHGLGGLVAALYAHRHRAWSDIIQRAVFIGVPLGGCFMPVEALIGRFALFEKLRLISVNPDEIDFPGMAATLPGLLDMLPNPRLFEGSEVLYTQAAWTEAGIPQPSQRWLDHSRNIKAALLQSPLLDRVTSLVSVDHGTTDHLRTYSDGFALGPREAPGDGVVPAESALVRGDLEAYRLTYPHADLVQEPNAITAVRDLLRTGSCSLEPLHRRDLSQTLPMPPGTDQRLGPEDVQGLRDRFKTGILMSRDVDWLMIPNLASVPSP